MKITPRMQEVHRLLAHGHLPSDISKQMQLSLYTVRGYISSLREHHGVSSVQQLVALWWLAQPKPCEECSHE